MRNVSDKVAEINQNTFYVQQLFSRKSGRLWHTYLLTPRSRALLEKLFGFQLVKKFPEFYGTRRFITAFTSARHMSLYWASSIQSITPHPTSSRSILVLSSHPFLGFWISSHGQPTNGWSSSLGVGRGASNSSP